MTRTKTAALTYLSPLLFRASSPESPTPKLVLLFVIVIANLAASRMTLRFSDIISLWKKLQ